MIFTDVSQPAFPDLWDFPTLPTTPVATDATDEEMAICQEPALPASRHQAKLHSGWRDMFTDIQHGLQWGLNH